MLLKDYERKNSADIKIGREPQGAWSQEGK
jgi:hypothetical protein